MIELSQKYRLKALASEQSAREADDGAIRAAWIEIGIEWHALASRTAQEARKLT
jgi:hypothetical protein